MLWFNKEKKRRMEFIQSFIPTSKAQLIQVAMWYHKGDVGKAQEMVDFYTKNMQLPDFDHVKPTFIQQVRCSASELYSWIKDNQDDLVQGYKFIQGIIANKGAVVPSVPDTVEPIPMINQQ